MNVAARTALVALLLLSHGLGAVSEKAHGQSVEEGEAIFESIAELYRGVRPSVWGVATASPEVFLLIPDQEWERLPHEDQVSLTLFAESLIPSNGAHREPSRRLRRRSLYETVRAQAFEVCGDCWAIGVGGLTANKDGVLLDRVAVRGDSVWERSDPGRYRGVKASEFRRMADGPPAGGSRSPTRVAKAGTKAAVAKAASLSPEPSAGTRHVEEKPPVPKAVTVARATPKKTRTIERHVRPKPPANEAPHEKPKEASGPVVAQAPRKKEAPPAAPKADRASGREPILAARSTRVCVPDLLSQAEDHLAAERLILPARDNALESYEEALRAATRYQTAALAGIEAIKQQYVDWAEAAKKSGDWAEAAAFYKKALTVTPRDQGLILALGAVEARSTGRESGQVLQARARARAAGGEADGLAEDVERREAQPDEPEETHDRIASRLCAGARDPADCLHTALNPGIYRASGVPSRGTDRRTVPSTQARPNSVPSRRDDSGARDARSMAEALAIARRTLMTVRSAAPRQPQTDRTPAPRAAGENGKWAVQVAALRDSKTAETQAAKLQDAGYHAYLTSADALGPDGRRVRVGPFVSRGEARRAAARIRSELKIERAFVVPSPAVAN